MNVVEEIKKFVEEECKKPTSKYGYEPFEGHFVPVVNYAVQLAEIKKADIEIVEIAAWLHDIGSIIDGRENHHITSSEIAEQKLKELGVREEVIKKVKHCIVSHRGSQNIKRESIEAEIISEADGMSIFDNIIGLIRAALVNEKLSEKEARVSVKNHLVNSYNKISPEGKEIIKPKFDAAMLLL